MLLVTYPGAIEYTVTVADKTAKTPAITVTTPEGVTLINGVDYTVSYADNILPGIATVVIAGIGMYVDQVELSYTILPYNAGMESVYDDGVVYKVTSIGQKAFYKNSKIKSIVIGNNVKSIESYAFYACTNVTSIKLGRAVEIIGPFSFRKCTKLTSITLPKKVDELGKNAFYGCTRLKTIIINANSVVDIEDNAIKGISKKAVIKVPKKYLKKYQKEFGKKSGYTKTMKIKAK